MWQSLMKEDEKRMHTFEIWVCKIMYSLYYIHTLHMCIIFMELFVEITPRFRFLLLIE